MNYQQLRHFGLRHETAIAVSEAIDEAVREERLATLQWVLYMLHNASLISEACRAVDAEIARLTRRGTQEAE